MSFGLVPITKHIAEILSDIIKIIHCFVVQRRVNTYVLY